MAGAPGQHIRMLQEKLADSNQALEDETSRTAQLKMANEYLQNEVQKGKTAYDKLETHAKECEQAVERAQKSSKQDKGYAENTVKSQKVQLKAADRRYDEITRELNQWRDKYGWSVELPAQEKLALQASLSEWQSKAEKAQTHITLLEGQIQGTPDQIGLHQALEEWNEHQSCSEGFADLEDQIHDGTMIKQKLEQDLATSKQRYQKAKSDITELRSRVKQLEEGSMNSRGLPITPEQVEQAEKAFQELQIKANQLEQDKQALQDQDKTNEYIQCIQKLQSDLNAITEVRQETDVKMKALQEQNDQLQQASNTFLGQDGGRTEMLQKLDSGLKMEQEQHQATKLNMEALQGKADQLESELRAVNEHNQTRNSSIEALQGKANQLESELRAANEHNQTRSSSIEALQGKAHQLESDLRAAKEHDQTTSSSMEALQGKADQLESDLKVQKEHNQTINSSMEALQGKADQLESDLKVQKEHNQTLKSDMEMLEDDADRLRSALEPLDDEYPGPSPEELKAEAEADRLWSENQQRLKSEMEALQAEGDQLKQNRHKLDMEFLEAEKSKQVEKSNPEIAEAVGRDIEAGKGKQAEKSEEVKNLNPETVPVWPGIKVGPKLNAQWKSRKDSEQDEKVLHVEKETHQASGHKQIAPPMSPIYTTDEGSLDLEKTPRPKKSLRQDLGYSSREHSEIWSSDVSLSQYQGGKVSKPVVKSDVSLPQHQGGKVSKPVGKSDVSLAQHQGGKVSKPVGKSDMSVPQFLDGKMSKPVEKSDVSVPQFLDGKMSKPVEKSDVSVPQFHSGKMSKPVGKSDVSVPQFHGGKMSKPAGKANVSPPRYQGRKTSKQADQEFWESDDSDGADLLIEMPVGRKMTKLQSVERHAKNMAAREIRAKEQPEAIESLFECTPAKAHTIDRRLKALGPGCRLLEAPALVAYELSGIPEDTYKGLVSGQLLATLPPKDANDTGPTLMHSKGTDTTDLPTKEVTDSLVPNKNIATDATNLPIDQPTITHTGSSSWTLSDYIMPLLMLLMILLSFLFLYMSHESGQSLKTASGVVYKNAYSLRYMPTPSISAATPVTFVYPPTPAPQLGLARMLMASSSGRGMKGGRW